MAHSFPICLFASGMWPFTPCVFFVPPQLVCRYPRRGPLCHLGCSDLLRKCVLLCRILRVTYHACCSDALLCVSHLQLLWLAPSVRGSSIHAGVHPMCASVHPLCTCVHPLCTCVHPLCVRVSPLCVGIHLVHAGVILILARVCLICAGVHPICSGVRPVCAGVCPVCQVVCPICAGIYLDRGEGQH